MKEKVVFRELSYRVMEAVFEVHNTLGPGFLENVYEEALAYELEARNIPFKRQRTIQIRYKGKVIGTHRLDLLVDDKIVLELKAVSSLNNFFKQQTLSYLRATNMRLGILINFGRPRVEYSRIVN